MKFIGEFAIGTNYGIDRFTRSILLDEKIGGSFHMALGAATRNQRESQPPVLGYDRSAPT
jgi:aminopeptidase